MPSLFSSTRKHISDLVSSVSHAFSPIKKNDAKAKKDSESDQKIFEEWHKKPIEERRKVWAEALENVAQREEIVKAYKEPKAKAEMHKAELDRLTKVPVRESSDNNEILKKEIAGRDSVKWVGKGKEELTLRRKGKSRAPSADYDWEVPMRKNIPEVAKPRKQGDIISPERKKELNDYLFNQLTDNQINSWLNVKTTAPNTDNKTTPFSLDSILARGADKPRYADINGKIPTPACVNEPLKRVSPSLSANSIKLAK